MHTSVSSHKNTSRAADTDAERGVTDCAYLPALSFGLSELPPREQFSCYADALIPAVVAAGRYAEVRAIETWTSAGKKRSRVVANLWLRPSEFKVSFEILSELNETANIFVGVNLRSGRQGTKDSVQEAWCISADIDYCSPQAANLACRRLGLPEPSILVDSGHGSHVYYLFESPYRFRTRTDLELFEEAARGFQRAIGADFTNDVTRLLRIAGLLNTKDLRNGASPVPCVLVHCEPTRRCPSALFTDRWRPEEKPSRPISLDAHYLPDARTERRIRGLVNYLANDQVSDRSRRDFGVLMGLLRLGLSPEQIWPLVQDYSKFGTNGERYFRTTIGNAQRALERQSFFE